MQLSYENDTSIRVKMLLFQHNTKINATMESDMMSMDYHSLTTSDTVTNRRIDIEFVKEPDQFLLCFLCKGLFQQPIQCDCGHVFCHSCLDNLFTVESSEIACPCSEENFPCDLIIRDKVMRRRDNAKIRDINKLKVYCAFKKFGCPETMPLSDLQRKHVSNCDYGTYCCFCDESTKKDSLQEHLMNACTMYTVECEYGCGLAILQHDKDSHSCSLKPRKCKYSAFGCKEVIVEDEMIIHEKTVDHFEMIIATFQDSLTKVMNDNTQLRDHLVNLSGIVTKQQNQYIEMSEKYSKLINNQAATHGSLASQIHDIEARMVNKNTSSASIEDIREQVSAHDRTMREINLRLECAETASYDGVLFWKIGHFDKHRKQAIDNTVTSLYSQPFYTSRHGYKMCARLFPNGDGVGKGTFMSLFFVVMRGDHDEILKWPFKGKVTLSLLDQVNHTNDVVSFFCTHNIDQSISFRKPITDFNTASGCPLFIMLSVLESPREPYLRNNAIFIKVTVEMQSPCVG